MILSHGLKHSAPPKVSVNLNVPFFPAGIDRVTPAFFLQQLENRPEQMMSIPPFFAPKSTAAQAASHRARRQLFVGADNGSRGAFEMKPGEVSRKSAHQRLNKRQAHHQQTRRHG